MISHSNLEEGGNKKNPGKSRAGRGGRTDLKFCQCGWWAKRTHASYTNSVLYTQHRTHLPNQPIEADVPTCHRNHVAPSCVREQARGLYCSVPHSRNGHQPPPNTRRVTGGPSGVWSSPTKPPAPHQSPLHLAHHTNSSPRPPKHKASDLSHLRRRFVRVQGRREEMAATEGVLLGMGNPLLDISAVVDDAFLAK